VSEAFVKNSQGRLSGLLCGLCVFAGNLGWFSAKAAKKIEQRFGIIE
jgi:hypothetical protein